MLKVINPTTLLLDGVTYPCTIGRNGFAAPGEKREGDGKTPTGAFPLRAIYYRPDRLAIPKTKLPARPMTPVLGWCDDPTHPAYNLPVILPFPASHERLWREDACYDLIVPLGYNDDPAIPGLGSAIFLHCMHDDGRPTAGCVAVEQNILLQLIESLQENAVITMGSTH